MEICQNIISSEKTSKKLIILSKKDRKMKCSICNEPLYPTKIEIWEGDILNLSDVTNFFCEKCGLFEYEPENDAEIYFNNLRHQEIYLEQLRSFL